MELGRQLVYLIVLAVPIACVTWTGTHEAIFTEFRDWCAAKSRSSERLIGRRFFYVFTCEYCFSHYVAFGALLLTGYRLLYGDWRGFFMAAFSLVWLANLYMAIFGRLRLEIKAERLDVAAKEARDAVSRPSRQRVS